MCKKFKNLKLPMFLKILFNILSWAFLGILVIVAAFLVYYLIMKSVFSIKGKEYNPKFSMYTIISPSMVPNIKVYDVVVDIRVDDISKIKQGDIVTFKSNASLTEGKTITHRVIEIINNNGTIKIRTKGDDNLSPDSSFVTSENILGKVMFKIPQLGRIQSLILSSKGGIILLLVPIILFMFIDFKKLFGLNDIKEKLANEELETAKDAILIDNSILKDKIKNRINETNLIEEPKKENINDNDQKRLLDEISDNLREEIEQYEKNVIGDITYFSSKVIASDDLINQEQELFEIKENIKSEINEAKKVEVPIKSSLVDNRLESINYAINKKVSIHKPNPSTMPKKKKNNSKKHHRYYLHNNRNSKQSNTKKAK